VNLTDDRILGRFLSGFTIVKVLLILAFIAGAIFLPGGVHNSLVPRANDGALFISPAFAISLVYVMYAYEGWNGAAYVAGEVENPQKNMPRALIIGTVIVTVLYVAVHAVFLWRAPWAAMEGKPEAALIAAQSIFGETGGKFMGFLIAFGLISTVASMICAGSRVNERMGEDVPFLKPLAYQNKAGTPVVSVLLVAAMSLVMLFTKTFDEVLRYVECLLLVSSCLAVLSVIWLRIRRPDAPRPFRVPLFPITPLLFAGMTIYMITFMARQHPDELKWGLATLAAGLVVYAAGTLWQKART
jgi:APA family basic amino acid/polyamine antiporter